MAVEAARALAMAASTLSRRLGAGTGSTIGGRVLLALDRDAIKHLAKNRTIVTVSGTNGKTTTTRMVATALAATRSVSSNAEGANLPSGWAWALLSSPESTAAVLEVDELYLPAALAGAEPAVVTLLNLTRDQLDRSGEVGLIAKRWHDALGRGCDAVVVANADDPLVAWAASAAPKVVWVSVGQRWTADASACAACGRLLVGAGSDWWCRCGLRRPNPDYVLSDTTIHTPAGERLALQLALPGPANAANATFAVAAAALLGVSPAVALPAISSIREIAGRYSTFSVGGAQRQLWLAKNPAGWAESLVMLPPDVAVVIAINARQADGRDPSWLWDVPFEHLRGRKVVATGERAWDVAVRLHYAEVAHEVVGDLRQALAWWHEPAIVLANYTAFRQIRQFGGRHGLS